MDIQVDKFDKNQFESALTIVERIAIEAGRLILDIYQNDDSIDVKTKDDQSPVTKADLSANQYIVDALEQHFPDIPVLSEESFNETVDQQRQGWDTMWLVDPLDGTREFIDRTGEFTVNIALIHNTRAILGVVYLPQKQWLYSAFNGGGAYKQSGEERTRIASHAASDGRLDNKTAAPPQMPSCLSIVISRRHQSEATKTAVAKVSQHFRKHTLLEVGSSLKICALAEGRAHWYPRLGPTSEWDIAAAQVVLEEAGGVVVDERFQPLRYNKAQSILNPNFHAFGLPDLPWQQWLE